MLRSLFVVFFIGYSWFGFAQNNRLNTYNSIGWYNLFGTFKLNQKWGLHAEYQFRRDDYISNPQQGLLRLGINYTLNPQVLFRVGYAWIETAAYGELPINGFGKGFTEHRVFQLVQLNQKEGIVELSHRFMLEQRWVGRYSTALLEKEDEFVFMNRLRYLFRVQLPLKNKEMLDKTPYVAGYNEIFIGFGQNVNANVFDQNRSALLIGYKWNKTLRIEAGYLNQTLQFGRLVGGKNVFQRNNGIIVNAYLNIEKKKKE